MNFWGENGRPHEQETEDTKSTVHGLSDRIDHVHDKSAANKDESKQRKEDSVAVEAAFDAMTTRFVTLETAEKRSEGAPHQQQQHIAQQQRGWQPQHNILGGWGGTTSKMEIEAAAAT